MAFFGIETRTMRDREVRGEEVILPLRRRSIWVMDLYHRINTWFAALVTRHAPNKNIAVLDGVRAVACVAVIIFHINLITYRLHLWNPQALGPLTSSLAL